ncbi:GNAT family N-acetyltransferase [Demequina aestuarii]|uniref:GNAT family N-acetyltransferase n=1 Tax=Demequina aestuarii TaxID=327095 RepID=UPI0007812A6F|nr:GNAT family N-acetyltransferase [Demequina aestuarii]
MTPPIRTATVADVDAGALTLARAFDRYAWTRWAIPDEDYAARLVEMQRLYLGHALQHGRVLVEQHVRAVAAVLPPDAPPPAPSTQDRIGALHGDRLGALAAIALPNPPERAWLLATVGVAPAHQGAGLGTALVEAGLRVVDERGASIALETSDERNVRLYERCGFAVVATTKVPGGPVVHSMVRSRR